MAEQVEICTCGKDAYAHYLFSEVDKIRFGLRKEHLKVMRLAMAYSIKSSRYVCHEYKRDNLRYLEEVSKHA